MLTRRQFLQIGAALGATAGLTMPAFAKSDAVQMIVPFPPGGGGDTLARTMIDKMSQALGRQIWVNNRPGAGGSIGTGMMTRAKADGLTVGYVTNGTLCVNPVLYDLHYDPLKDLLPVGRMTQLGLIVALNPNVIEGVTDMPSLLAYAKKHPGVVNFASAGNGTTSHLAGLYLQKAAGIELTHIPFKGGAPAMMDVLAGRIPLMIDVAPNVLKHVASGKIKALACTTPERLKAAPDLPTLAEAGVPNMTIYAWDGLVVPKDTPADVVNQLNAALQTAMRDPEIAKRYKAKGAEPTPGSAGEFAEFIALEAPKWHSLVGAIQ